MLPALYLLWKLSVHGGIVFYELQLAIFATISGENICYENSVNQTCPDKVYQIENTRVGFLWYSLSYLVVFLVEVGASFFFFELVVEANKNLHNLALVGVLKSPMRFFNTNSVGRIMNRFSQDLGRADNLLPVTANETIFILFNFFGALVLAVYTNWFNIVIALPLGVYLIWLRQYYASTGREVKRLESMSKSPIYNYVSETMTGRPVLKAMKLEKVLVEKFMDVEDNHTAFYQMFIITKRWLAFRLEIVISLSLIVITIIFVELSKSTGKVYGEKIRFLVNFVKYR